MVLQNSFELIWATAIELRFPLNEIESLSFFVSSFACSFIHSFVLAIVCYYDTIFEINFLL